MFKHSKIPFLSIKEELLVVYEYIKISITVAKIYTF